MLSVQNLRQMGYKVKVWHTRNEIEKQRFGGFSYELDPHGGMTEVEIYDMNAQQSYVGLATCSDKDNYCRKLGVKIALGRALKKMSMDGVQHSTYKLSSHTTLKELSEECPKIAAAIKEVFGKT
jgi:hypothetical protein